MSTATLKYSDLDQGRVKQEVTFATRIHHHRDWVEGTKGRGGIWTAGSAPSDWDLPHSVTTHLTPQELLAVENGLGVPAVLRRLQVLRQQTIEAAAKSAVTFISHDDEDEEEVSLGDAVAEAPAAVIEDVVIADAQPVDEEEDAQRIADHLADEANLIAVAQAEEDAAAAYEEADRQEHEDELAFFDAVEEESPEETFDLVAEDVVEDTAELAEAVNEVFEEASVVVEDVPVIEAPAVIATYTEAQEALRDHGGLSALIPQSLSTPWVERSDGINSANEFEVAEGARADGENLLLYGPTGTGKTHFAQAVAHKLQLPFIIFSGSASGDVETLIGYDQIVGGDTRFVQGLLLEAIQYPGGAVICLDELNFFRPEILTPMFPLLASTRSITVPGANGGKVFSAVNGTLVIATLNPNYAGTQELNEALKRRFQIRTEWGYDPKVEAGLIKSASLREIADKLRANKTEIYSDIATPTLVEFEKYTAKYSLQFAVNNFVANFEREQEKQIARGLFNTYRANLAEEFSVSADQIKLEESGEFNDLDI